MSSEINSALLRTVIYEHNDRFTRKKPSVERSALADIAKALKSPYIIVISGLRRVGKSTLLAQICAHGLVEEFYYISFDDERLANFSVSQFDLLFETFVSLYGERKVFLCDEIQNIPEWERFVRRMHDQGYKFVITGSNASLLSQELGTRLTGRCITISLLPFSFREYLSFIEQEIPDDIVSTADRGNFIRFARDYLRLGGIADSLKYPELDIHQLLYDDLLYRDIVARYNIANVAALRELTFYLLSNVSCFISYNKIKAMLGLSSVTTVKNYISYLENSWLFFSINKYSYSVKEQQISAKKIYCIDTGLVNSVGFAFSENYGKLMENLVFLQLTRAKKSVYYYKTKENYEVDFYIPKENHFIQVTQNLNSTSFDREVRALLGAGSEHQNSRLTLITENHEETIIRSGQIIEVIPLYKWLLYDSNKLLNNV